jgi:TolA-binding protein
MAKMNGHIVKLRAKTDRSGFSAGIYRDLESGNREITLAGKIEDYFRALNDIDDVMKDPAYNDTMTIAESSIAEFRQKEGVNSENMRFVTEGMDSVQYNRELVNEVNQVLNEIGRSNVDKITSDWVKEWHSRRQSEAEKEKRKEIGDFIKDSLNAETEKAPVEIVPKPEPVTQRKIRELGLFKYLPLAAAVMAGAVLVISSLNPAYDPDKVFSEYYEPFKAVSPVTRSTQSSTSMEYSAAIESYRSGNFQESATAFSGIASHDVTSSSARFFLGLTLIQMDKYEEAVLHLQPVADSREGYVKEAKWYLGLTYIKLGEMEKAAKYFEELSQTPGYYSDRSGKILRRIK